MIETQWAKVPRLMGLIMILFLLISPCIMAADVPDKDGDIMACKYTWRGKDSITTSDISTATCGIAEYAPLGTGPHAVALAAGDRKLLGDPCELTSTNFMRFASNNAFSGYCSGDEWNCTDVPFACVLSGIASHSNT